MRGALIGNTNGFKKGVGFWAGKTRSEETNRKISEALRGRRLSQTTREKMAEVRKGERNPAWKGGISMNPNYSRIARKNRAEGSHTHQEWKDLKITYGNTCPSCHRREPEIKLTEDHIVPISKGGTDYIENIQPLCGTCNSRKATKVIKYNYVST